MKIYFTLDYELFLGSSTGSVELCLVKPMEYLCGIADKHNIKFTIFVDATYLSALKKFSKYQQLARDYKIVVQNLLSLKQAGHTIGLHIHPHWFYADYNGENWITPPGHYKLTDIPFGEARAILMDSKDLLEEIVNAKVSTFRAGGFSIQPFEPYAEVFEELGLKIDSSVLSGLYYNSDNQQYDYQNAPYKDYYRFNKNIDREDEKGSFEEYPVSTHTVFPAFWWKLSLLKILHNKGHKPFGNGRSVETTSESIISRLTRAQMGFACMDGYKSSLLFAMREKHQKTFGTDARFVVIGHPKLATAYSIKTMDKFIADSFDRHSFEVF
jgi:peptidoglycan/xylan/chitin deacetylase (PgdA/CDA1 family)